jgi:hypothetical protein
MSIFLNVDGVTSLTMVVCLAVIFAIVDMRLRLSLLRKQAKQLSEDVQRLTIWSKKRRLNQLKAAQQKTDKHKLPPDVDPLR